MALTSSSALTVFKTISSSTTSTKLTFLLTPVSHLFIGTIVLTRVNSATAISGTMVRGVDATHPSKILLNANGPTFDACHAQVLPFKVVIGYDDVTLDIVQLDFIHDQAFASQASVDAVLDAVQALIPPQGPTAAVSRDGKQQPQKRSGVTS